MNQRCAADRQRNVGRDAIASLRGVAPKGIEALREQIASIPEPMEGDDDLPTVEEAQEREAAAKNALATPTARLEAIRVELGDAQMKAARAAAAVESAEGRQKRAEDQIASIEDPEAERNRLQTGRSQTSDCAKRGYAAAQRDRCVGTGSRSRTDCAGEGPQSIIHRAEEDRKRIRIELAKLDTKVDLLAGEAIEEELSDVIVRSDDAERVLAEINFEIAVLQTLEAALDEARASARDRYVEPVITELEPLVRLLWPEAVMRIDPEKVLPTTLKRSGTEEKCEVLSGGTKETDSASCPARFCQDAGEKRHPSACHTR